MQITLRKCVDPDAGTWIEAGYLAHQNTFPFELDLDIDYYLPQISTMSPTLPR